MALQDQPSPGGYSSATHDGYTIESNRATEDEIRESLEAPTADEEKSKAASTLGKAGAKSKKAAKATDEEPAEKAAPKAKAKTQPKAVPEPDEDEEHQKPAAKAKPEPDEDEEADEAEPAKSKKGNPRYDPEARKAQIAAEIRELADERRKLQADRDRIAREVQAKAKPAEQEDAEPAWDDYEALGKDVGTYLAEHEQWAARQAVKKHEAERTAKERHETIVRETKKFIETYEKRMNDYEAENEGYLETVDKRLLAIPPARVLPLQERTPVNYFVDEILSSEMAPQLWAYFSEQPKEFQRLATLHPRTLMREIARLEVSLSGSKAAATAGNQRPKTESSKAAAPLRPVRATPDIPEPEPDDDASYDAHVSWHNAREARRRAGAGR